MTRQDIKDRIAALRAEIKALQAIKLPPGRKLIERNPDYIQDCIERQRTYSKRYYQKKKGL